VKFVILAISRNFYIRNICCFRSPDKRSTDSVYHLQLFTLQSFLLKQWVKLTIKLAWKMLWRILFLLTTEHVTSLHMPQQCQNLLHAHKWSSQFFLRYVKSYFVYFTDSFTFLIKHQLDITNK
jgi:hypothetical protein